MSISNWADRDLEQLLSRASEHMRKQEDARTLVDAVRATFVAQESTREAEQQAVAQASKRSSLVRLSLWSVIALGGLAGAGFVLARILGK